MKKYKLIKEYPGSPKLGLEVFKNGNYYQSEFDLKNVEHFHQPISLIENNPEFWEEIIEVEKEYEILSFINKHNQIFYKSWQSLLYNHFYITYGFYLEEILENKNNNNRLYNKDLKSYQCKVEEQEFKIHSVKRLLDNKIFTIGDKIEIIDEKSSKKNLTIKDFEIYNVILPIETNTIIIYTKENNGFLGGNKGNGVNLCKVKHYKQPLFTTEDGVDIFENDYCYFVRNNFSPIEKPFHCTKEFWSGNLKFYKWFSTKEAAEEYILMNKPCLSLNNILHNATNDSNGRIEISFDYFKELIKTKLNL